MFMEIFLSLMFIVYTIVFGACAYFSNDMLPNKSLTFVNLLFAGITLFLVPAFMIFIAMMI